MFRLLMNPKGAIEMDVPHLKADLDYLRNFKEYFLLTEDAVGTARNDFQKAMDVIR